MKNKMHLLRNWITIDVLSKSRSLTLGVLELHFSARVFKMGLYKRGINQSRVRKPSFRVSDKPSAAFIALLKLKRVRCVKKIIILELPLSWVGLSIRGLCFVFTVCKYLSNLLLFYRDPCEVLCVTFATYLSYCCN